MVAVVLVVGCGFDKPPVREKSDWLVLRAPKDAQICSGTFAAMEAEVIRLFSMFEINRHTIDYSWLPPSDYSSEKFPCLNTDRGCAQGADIFARSPISTHELVHATRETLPVPLEEGLATVLELPYDRDSDVMASRDELLAALETTSWFDNPLSYAMYERAAHFVSFLLAEFGDEKFIEFDIRRRGDGDDYELLLADWADDFEVVYGHSFETVWALYDAYPDCGPAFFHRPLSACAMLGDPPQATLVADESLEPGPDARFVTNFSCDEEAIGPWVDVDDSFGKMATFRIDVDNRLGRFLSVDLVGTVVDDSRALLTACGSCWDGTAAMVTAESTKLLTNHLDSGAYALVLIQGLDEPGELGVALRW